MIVVDAGVLVAALTSGGPVGRSVRALLRPGPLYAPELVDLEVLSALRRLVATGVIDRRRADEAVADLAALPLRRAPHGPFVTRCWELRENLTPYDAAYVALAEALMCPLLTVDRRLAGAPGPRCEIRVVSEPDG